MKKKEHIVKTIKPGSIAEELEITPGDKVLAIDNTEIEDIFDYQFLTQDTYIEMLVEKADGEQWLLEIDKEFDEDLGIEFENGLMDEYRHCHNKCIFCFIDQMPPGMRETQYFKDDDSRLSFLQGNYVTLTNMSQEDIERVIKYHLSPINVSFQAMNPQLRCKMLHNRFAGDIFPKVQRLFEAGIEMNGQIVLCKGLNDKEELKYVSHDANAVELGIVLLENNYFYPARAISENEVNNTLQILESINSSLDVPDKNIIKYKDNIKTTNKYAVSRLNNLSIDFQDIVFSFNR